MYYKEREYFDTLKWDNIFEDVTEFEEKLSELGTLDLTALAPFDTLYYTLALKYVGAHTRYTSEFAFIMALIRELKIYYPIYLQQKTLMDDAMALELAEVQKVGQNIRNLVDNPNVPTTNPSDTVIPNLSTQQESIVQTTGQLAAIRAKYASVSQDYLKQFYNAIDPLFRVIVSNDDRWLYPQYI